MLGIFQIGSYSDGTSLNMVAAFPKPLGGLSWTIEALQRFRLVPILPNMTANRAVIVTI